MSPRVTVKVSVLLVLGRLIPSLTLVPFSPRSRFITALLVIFSPVAVESSIMMILSPARMPTFSLGPPGMTSTTPMVSLTIMNWMPMPLKEPFRSSVEAFRSSALK